LIIFGANRSGKESKSVPSLLASTVNFFLSFFFYAFSPLERRLVSILSLFSSFLAYSTSLPKKHKRMEHDAFCVTLLSRHRESTGGNLLTPLNKVCH